jgi:hypothetical protein
MVCRNSCSQRRDAPLSSRSLLRLGDHTPDTGTSRTAGPYARSSLTSEARGEPVVAGIAPDICHQHTSGSCFTMYTRSREINPFGELRLPVIPEPVLCKFPYLRELPSLHPGRKGHGTGRRGGTSGMTSARELMNRARRAMRARYKESSTIWIPRPVPLPLPVPRSVQRLLLMYSAKSTQRTL